MGVEVTIVAKPSGGLRVIPHIPAVRPCRLEGRNGVGKSAAIKLLRLVVGQQPFVGDQAAWESFRAGLGAQVEVHIKGLSGLDEVVMRCSPPDWPVQLPLRVGDWIGELRVNGQPSPAAGLGGLLRIEHLVGTERLADTFSRRYATYATALSAVEARLKIVHDQQAQLEELAEDLTTVSPVAQASDQLALSHSLESAGVVRAALESLEARIAALTRAASFHALANSADRSEDVVLRDRLKADLAVVNEAATAAASQLAAAVADLDAGDRQQKAVARHERQVSKLERELLALIETALQQAAELELGPRVPDEDSLVQMLADAENRYQDLDHEYRLAQMSEDERQLTSELELLLRDAVERGLGDFVVVRFSGQPHAVRDLLDAMERPVEASVSLDTELEGARLRAHALRELQTTFRELPKKEEALEKARAALEENLGQLTGADELRARVGDLRRTTDQLEQKRRDLARDLGALHARMHAGDVLLDGEQVIAETLASESILVGQIDARINELVADRYASLDAIKHAEAEIAELRERVSSRRRRRRALEAEADDAPRRRWVAAAVGRLDDAPDADHWFVVAADLVRARLDALEALHTHVAAAAYTAMQSQGPASDYRRALNTVVEAEALADLKEPSISQALFDEGRLLAVDLDRQAIAWEDDAGERHEKPISAFSSGEQALSFVRARLRQLALDPVPNRIIFLDEFGAFIAADRRQPLAELIRHEDGGLADQVVIVLPLQADYASQLSEVTGALADRYRSRVSALESAGYFTEEFDG